jgi:hypothetical protein
MHFPKVVYFLFIDVGLPFNPSWKSSASQTGVTPTSPQPKLPSTYFTAAQSFQRAFILFGCRLKRHLKPIAQQP